MTLPVSDHVHAVTWGYAGDTGGMYVICIWDVTQMGDYRFTQTLYVRSHL